MAKETTPAETDPIDPAQGGETDPAPDYKALYENALKESRKWESRSKANLKEPTSSRPQRPRRIRPWRSA